MMILTLCRTTVNFDMEPALLPQRNTSVKELHTVLQISGRMGCFGEHVPEATVADLAIGPNGEWWVRYVNGDWLVQDGSDSMIEAVEGLKENGESIVSMRFGKDFTRAITY